MNATIGSSRIANAILIEDSAGKFSLLELRSKRTILEKLFACVSWVPELQGSAGYSNKLQIIWLFRPLYVVDGIRTC